MTLVHFTGVTTYIPNRRRILVKMKFRVKASVACFAAIFAGQTYAQVCSSDIKILAQPQAGLTTTESFVSEFEELAGASFQIDYLNENDRRAKSRADASTIGKYNVYYVDEANLAQFASAGWIAPLLGHYPTEYEFQDFDAGRRLSLIHISEPTRPY